MSKSFNEGWDAFWAGLDLEDNPYCFAHEPYDEEQWDEGWLTANYVDLNYGG